MSSNVGQNYPYASETEAQRAAAIGAALDRFEGLRAKVETEATPVEPDADRWWTWVCPKHDYTGRLHVAGYALERHGVYTVCDTCGSTFLR